MQSTWSSTDSSVSSRKLRRIVPSPGVVEVRSVDRAELLARQASTTQAAARRTAPGSLDTVMPGRPPLPQKVVEPPTMVVHSPRSNGDSSPANSRRERYGIATIMSRGMHHQQNVVTAQPNTLTTQPVENTQTRAAAAADNSFDSLPTDYDVSDTTSRSRSGEPVTTTSMDSSSSATGAATAGSGGGGSLDTDSTDKSTSAGSHKLHQMRDDSGYKSLETQQSLGKSGTGVATASLLARIGTRSMDRSAPGLVSQPVSAAVVGRVQYSLEAPNVPVKFAATSPKLKDIVVPVPQLAVQEVKTTPYLEESATTTKTPSHSTITEFFAGISSGSSQSTNDDPTQKKQHIPFVPDAAFLEKFAERTQTARRALTSSFDRIRQQAGSLLSRTTAVVRGSSDVEAPVSHSVSSPYRRASSSECQSTWTEKESKLMDVPDPYYRRSNSGEVFTKDNQTQSSWITNPENVQVSCSGKSLYPPTFPRGSASSDPTRDKTTYTSFNTATESKFVELETVLTTTTIPSMVPQTSRSETRDNCKEMQPGSYQVLATETARGSTHHQDRTVYGTKPVSSSVIHPSSTAHPAWTYHVKQSHFVASETAASNPDFRRGNKKTASKRRRDYRSKKQVQEVHHSGSLTETTQHQPVPVGPVHGYSAVAAEQSSSDNSLEQPSTTSGGGSGASDASSSCEVIPEVRQKRGLSRDYSIDAKTNALFNEFVKYDPNLSGKRRTVLLTRSLFS